MEARNLFSDLAYTKCSFKGEYVRINAVPPRKKEAPINKIGPQQPAAEPNSFLETQSMIHVAK